MNYAEAELAGTIIGNLGFICIMIVVFLEPIKAAIKSMKKTCKKCSIYSCINQGVDRKACAQFTTRKNWMS